ncbi:MAG: TetR/AcrR family transcriptional regulator [Spirochaetales bacterium]|nr:MAG: TetR/AcrR family transcriptional regulator [Spirochaetales bacterium]
MKHEDILAAAFRVWGREAYKKMSLTEVAAELGVTKPALYRHFRDKDQLLAAMRAAFFDRYAEAMKAAFPSGLSGVTDSIPKVLRLLETLAAYFGARPWDMAFMFARIMRYSDVDQVFAAELAARDIKLDSQEGRPDPLRDQAQVAVATCFFLVALFHLERKRWQVPLPAARGELAGLTASILKLAAHGLGGGAGYTPGARAPSGFPDMDYAALDSKARLSQAETATPDGLLQAVAAVVAKAGSWNASMEMVAKRSGLSKSGLYSHFRSKEDMLLRLFSAEFERISEVIAKRLQGTNPPAERLYLAMASASEYLLARPDILVALDWMRMQRIGVPDLLPPRLLELFSFLEDKGAGMRLVGGSLGTTVRWILFLTIHQLMRCAGSAQPSHKECLRALHRFMLQGLMEEVIL